jgi:hypothetical protein
MSQLLACAVFDKKAGVRFFDGPGRREAAGGIYSFTVNYAVRFEAQLAQVSLEQRRPLRPSSVTLDRKSRTDPLSGLGLRLPNQSGN